VYENFLLLTPIIFRGDYKMPWTIVHLMVLGTAPASIHKPQHSPTKNQVDRLYQGLGPRLLVGSLS